MRAPSIHHLPSMVSLRSSLLAGMGLAACSDQVPVQGASSGAGGTGGTTCATGRPLYVDGRPRTAPAGSRADWTAPGFSLRITVLPAPTRAAAAQRWLEIAALEHASVASFARFTLELLALGAPAELLAGAQRAGLDEVEHARLAYAAASAYAGRPLGPEGLDLTAVEVRRDARAVMRSLILEGCVGETLGVTEATALAGEAHDVGLRRAHARIAADEQRHAELSWRALGWMLEGASAETARFVARCFDEAADVMGCDPAPTEVVAPEHGLLSASTIGELRRRALREVVAPCAAALLGHAGGHEAEAA
jgi:hypothetical protein